MFPHRVVFSSHDPRRINNFNSLRGSFFVSSIIEYIDKIIDKAPTFQFPSWEFLCFLSFRNNSFRAVSRIISIPFVGVSLFPPIITHELLDAPQFLFQFPSWEFLCFLYGSLAEQIVDAIWEFQFPSWEFLCFLDVMGEDFTDVYGVRFQFPSWEFLCFLFTTK